jgi:hypothetical protein
MKKKLQKKLLLQKQTINNLQRIRGGGDPTVLECPIYADNPSQQGLQTCIAMDGVAADCATIGYQPPSFVNSVCKSECYHKDTCMPA